MTAPANEVPLEYQVRIEDLLAATQERLRQMALEKVDLLTQIDTLTLALHAELSKSQITG